MNDPAPRSSRRPAKQRTGLLHAVRALSAAQQRTAAAALVVLVSLGTPWYATQVSFPGKDRAVDGTMSGITAFSFVEAGVLLVGVAVLALVWARATERRFSLPVADGTVVTAAAAWIGVLIVYRLFDRPESKIENGTSTLVGLSWGIFASLAAVGLLLATGLDQRRRDAEVRASTAAPVEGPVVDPEDLVAPAGPSGPPAPGGRPAWDGPDLPAAPRSSPPAERPAWDGPAERAVVPRPSAPAERPRESRPVSRSWSFDDPQNPAPPPGDQPSRRRPTPPPLGRGAAAAELRDAGLGGEPRRRAAPDTDPDRTRVTPPAPRTDRTRVVPPAPQQDRTRVTPADPVPEPAPDPATRVSRRERRRRDER
ncbi:hypothetical protein AB0L40_11040 [Patulibacter sp. NPDC049589]|uniref:hypothetical protein n=1 Tax=Patulibacter sp. NPDC049589 TaxID=3154731 RepID=UPI00341CF711